MEYRQNARRLQPLPGDGVNNFRDYFLVIVVIPTIIRMRYRLRTLLIVLALGPPVLAVAWLYGDLPQFWLFALLIMVIGLAAAWSLHAALLPRE
jgi:hypothetical protein